MEANAAAPAAAVGNAVGAIIGTFADGVVITVLAAVSVAGFCFTGFDLIAFGFSVLLHELIVLFIVVLPVDPITMGLGRIAAGLEVEGSISGKLFDDVAAAAVAVALTGNSCPLDDKINAVLFGDTGVLGLNKFLQFKIELRSKFVLTAFVFTVAAAVVVVVKLLVRRESKSILSCSSANEASAKSLLFVDVINGERQSLAVVVDDEDGEEELVGLLLFSGVDVGGTYAILPLDVIIKPP